MNFPKYPEITVKLSGNNGNAFFILGKIKKELKRAGVSEKEQKQFITEATTGDYSNLLFVCGKWVTIR